MQYKIQSKKQMLGSKQHNGKTIKILIFKYNNFQQNLSITLNKIWSAITLVKIRINKLIDLKIRNTNLIKNSKNVNKWTRKINKK